MALGLSLRVSWLCFLLSGGSNGFPAQNAYGYPYEPTYGYYGGVLSPRGSSSGQYGSVLGHNSYQPSKEGPSTSVVSSKDIQQAYYASNKWYEPNHFVNTPSKPNPGSGNTQEPGKVSSQLSNIPNAQRLVNDNAKNWVLVKPNPAATFTQSKGNQQGPGKKSVPVQPQQAPSSQKLLKMPSRPTPVKGIPQSWPDQLIPLSVPDQPGQVPSSMNLPEITNRPSAPQVAGHVQGNPQGYWVWVSADSTIGNRQGEGITSPSFPEQQELVPKIEQQELVPKIEQQELVPKIEQQELVPKIKQQEQVPWIKQKKLVPKIKQQEQVPWIKQKKLFPKIKQQEQVPWIKQKKLVPEIEQPGDVIKQTVSPPILPVLPPFSFIFQNRNSYERGRVVLSNTRYSPGDTAQTSVNVVSYEVSKPVPNSLSLDP